MLTGFSHDEGADILLHISSSLPLTSLTLYVVLEGCLHQRRFSQRINSEGDLVFFS